MNNSGNRLNNAAQMRAGGVDPYELQGSRTSLIQLYCNDTEEAPRIISEDHPKGVPLMAIMDGMPSCCYYKLNIPNGVWTLGMRYGANSGVMSPGAKWCYITCC
jgi:hypothetical protein